jgi:adenosylmethionine-8-amino-7-oxononanoate aminotransferase
MEACMKLAKQYFTMKGEPLRVNFISRKQSYHGATLGVLGLTGHIGRRTYYEDILKKASHISPFNPYHDMSADESEAQYIERLVEELEAKFQDLGLETVAAVVFEPLVGAVSIHISLCRHCKNEPRNSTRSATWLHNACRQARYLLSHWTILATHPASYVDH